MIPARSILLLLADGRFPAGGHAHSGGLEEAVGAGRVANGEELYRFLLGRLSTVGRSDAVLAAVACRWAGDGNTITALGKEAVARCPSPALRAASRAQGRGLLRAAAEIWPARAGPSARPPAAHPGGGDRGDGAPVMYPIALGLVGARSGLSPHEVALISAQNTISGPGWAATRLLGLSPFTVAGALARLGPQVEEVAVEASTLAGRPDGSGVAGLRGLLPAFSAPLSEIGAEAHSDWEVRLFAS